MKGIEEMTLRQKQSKFARLVPLLLLFAYEKGYEITFGDCWAKTGHKKNSYHYKRLAVDLNLFKDGKYLRSTKAHKFLGIFWENLDPCCAWGGRFNESKKQAGDGQDGNHYEFH